MGDRSVDADCWRIDAGCLPKQAMQRTRILAPTPAKESPPSNFTTAQIASKNSARLASPSLHRSRALGAARQ